MTLSLGSAGDAQLAADAVAPAYLVELRFGDGTQYLSTLPVTRTYYGVSWRGVDQHLRVDTISTSEDGTPDRVKLSLPITSLDVLAATLGNVGNYRGRRVVIWFQAFTPAFVLAGTRQVEWQGCMEPVQIKPQRGEGGIVGRIEMPCSRFGLARARNVQGLRLTNAQQQAAYPGDLFCEYVGKLLEEPSTWLSKRFQEMQ